jgi:2-desacetyl-2-hydroxyethyl bacteriochlorophyllide A dehydrogenase
MTETEYVVFEDRQAATIESERRPTPEAEELLIETHRTLLSTGTELTHFGGDVPADSTWDRITTYPHRPGYSNVGTVLDVGSGVDDRWIGRRVVTWQGHASHVTAPVDEAVEVPASVSDAAACFFSLATVAMNGIRRGRLEWGESVAIYGLGVVGQLTVRLCSVAGATPVVGVEPAPNRREYLPERPPVSGVSAGEDDVRAAIETRGGSPTVDVVFEATGRPEVIPAELDVLRDQGRCVLLSSPRGETTFDFHDRCNFPSYEIIGAHNRSHPQTATPANPWTRQNHVELFLQYVHEDRLAPESLVSDVVASIDAPAIYEDLYRDRTRAMAVQFEW